MAQRASTYVVETGDESGLVLLLAVGGAAAAFFAWKEGWFGPKSVADPIPLKPGIVGKPVPLKPAQVGTIKVLPGPPVPLGPRTPVKLGPAKKAPGPPIKLQPSNPVKLGPGRPVGPGKPIALKPSNPISLGPRTPVKLQPGLTKPVSLQPGLTKPVPLQPHAPSPPLLKPLPMVQPQCLQTGTIGLDGKLHGYGLQRNEPNPANCHAVMPGYSQAYWGTFYGSKTGWKGHFTDTSAKTCALKFTNGLGACDPKTLPPTGSVR